MIKRDTIQRYSAVLTKDAMGGDIVDLIPAENVRSLSAEAVLRLTVKLPLSVTRLTRIMIKFT